MEKLLKEIEQIVRKNFDENIHCEIEYESILFDDEIDIKICQGDGFSDKIIDDNYIEHRNQLAEELHKNLSDKIKSMELYTPDSGIVEYVFKGLDFRGIELKIDMSKIKKVDDFSTRIII